MDKRKVAIEDLTYVETVPSCPKEVWDEEQDQTNITDEPEGTVKVELEELLPERSEGRSRSQMQRQYTAMAIL